MRTLRKWPFLLITALLFQIPLLAVDIQIEEETVNLDIDNIRNRNRVAMTSDGYVWFLFSPAGTYNRLDAVYLGPWGTSYTYATNLVTCGTARNPAVDLHSFGDTLVWAADAVSDANSAFLGLINNTTNVMDTTLSGASYGNWVGRPFAGLIGTLPLSLNVINVAVDSAMLSIATAWPQTGDFVVKQVLTPTLLGDGWRTPLYYNGVGWGALVYEAGATNNDMYVCDTLGFTEINTNVFPNVGMFQAYTFLMLDDSNGVAIYQEDDDPGDSVMAFTFKIRGTGGATPTWVAGADTTLILSSANVPDGFNSCPTVQHLVGTDSLFAFYLFWNDTANYDSADIAYKVSADKGATWGSQQIARAATNGFSTFNLQTHETNYRDGSGNLLAYGITTRQATVDDSAWIWIDTLEVGAAPANTGRVIIVQ